MTLIPNKGGRLNLILKDGSVFELFFPLQLKRTDYHKWWEYWREHEDITK